MRLDFLGTNELLSDKLQSGKPFSCLRIDNTAGYVLDCIFKNIPMSPAFYSNSTLIEGGVYPTNMEYGINVVQKETFKIMEKADILGFVDISNETTKVSICIPIKTEIFISPGSDIISGKIEAMQAVKTTLYGDYSHLQETKDIATAFLNKYKLKANPVFLAIESYKISKIESKKPSKWVTEVFLPIQPKPLPPKKVYKAPSKPVTAPVRKKEQPINIITPVPVSIETE